MNKYLLLACLPLVFAEFAVAQCSTTNATTCVCETPGATNCDLLPDIIVALPPLLATGNSGVIEYSQTGNGGNDGRLRVSVSSPNIGHGPLEIRTTNTYICGTDTIVGTAPTTCPTTGLPPRQLIVQRVYTKNGATMTHYDRDAGSMTYHPTHGHMHVDDWGVHTLRTMTPDPNPLNWPIVGAGAKLGFCLMDYGSCSTYSGHCVDSTGATLLNGNFPNYGLGGGSYNCSPTVQGISSGFTDIYYQYLDGMYITIPPGVCNGQYYLVVQLDPNNYFLEENENNNLLVVPYTLTMQSGTVPTITTSGPTDLCPGSSVTLLSSPALSYLWSTGATTQSITVSTPGTYTVTTDTGTACSTSSLPVTVTSQAMPVMVTPVSNTLCEGQSTTLNTSVTAPPNGTVQTSFSNSTVYNIPDNNATGVLSPVTVSGISPATLASGAIFSVQINITHTYDGDLLIALISPSGNTINLSNRRGSYGDNFINTVFSMTGAMPIANGTAPFTGSFIPDGSFNSLGGNANGTWQLKVADLAGADVGTINSWTLTLNNVVPTQLTYSWTSDPAGFTSSDPGPIVTPTASTTYTVVVNNITNGCSGSATTAITVEAYTVVLISGNNVICAGDATTLTASGADTYQWSPSTGLDTTSGAIVSANPATTTTYTVTGSSPSGCTSTQTVTVTVNSNPVVTLGAFSAVCNNAAAFTLSGGAPAGGTYSGPGVSSGMFYPATAGTGTHTITYSYDNGCTGTATSPITVNNCNCIPPGPPGNIYGTAYPCPGATINYYVTNLAYVSNYNWVPPPNTTILSGQGTHSIMLQIGANYTTGSLCVTASNICGTSAPKCKTLNKIKSRTPGNILGNKYGHCESVVNLSIASVAGAVSYNWTLPSGTTYISGQGTTAISFSTNAGFVSGLVCVTAYNGCANSIARCTYIYAGPAKPVISGPTTVCANQAGVTYSVSPVYGATLYTWGVPSGSTIVSGQGTTSIVVNFGSVADKIRCTAKNVCGNRGTSTLYYTFNCRLGTDDAADFDLSVVPNPATDYTEILISGNVGENAVVTLSNILGKEVYSHSYDLIRENRIPLDLSNLSKGIYMVCVTHGNMKRYTRLIVD